MADDTVFSFTLNYTDTEVTHETDFLSGADVLAIERGVPGCAGTPPSTSGWGGSVSSGA